MAVVMRRRLEGVGGAERESIDDFLQRHRAPTYRLALSILGRPELAEDVAQESLIRAFRARHKLQGADDPTAFARRITVRLAITALRRTRFERPLPEDMPDGDRTERNAQVRDALARLDPEHQAILALVVGEGLSYGEAAETLGIPEGTVASRLSAARAAFKKEWNR